MHCHHFQRGALERDLAGQQFVQDDAEAVDVGAGAHRADVAANLLRRHVRRRAGDGPFVGLFGRSGANLACQARVGQ